MFLPAATLMIPPPVPEAEEEEESSHDVGAAASANVPTSEGERMSYHLNILSSEAERRMLGSGPQTRDLMAPVWSVGGSSKAMDAELSGAEEPLEEGRPLLAVPARARSHTRTRFSIPPVAKRRFALSPSPAAKATARTMWLCPSTAIVSPVKVSHTLALKSALPVAASVASEESLALQIAPLCPMKVPIQSPVRPSRSMGLLSLHAVIM